MGAADSDDLIGLRPGNHALEIGVFIGRFRFRVALSLALCAPLLLILLLLFANLLSATFFQLSVLSLWPIAPASFDKAR